MIWLERAHATQAAYADCIRGDYRVKENANQHAMLVHYTRSRNEIEQQSCCKLCYHPFTNPFTVNSQQSLLTTMLRTVLAKTDLPLAETNGCITKLQHFASLSLHVQHIYLPQHACSHDYSPSVYEACVDGCMVVLQVTLPALPELGSHSWKVDSCLTRLVFFIMVTILLLHGNYRFIAGGLESVRQT